MPPGARAPLVAALLFVLYAVTGMRDVQYWDTGEMAYVPYVLGIAHPSGFPLYVLLGFLWSHALPFATVAYRMSLLSAACMAVAALGVARVARGSALAVVLFGLGGIVWNDATRPEVHAAFVCAAVWSLVFALQWYESNRDRDAWCCALFWGASAAVHPLALALVPSLLTIVVARLHVARTRLLVGCALAASAVAVIPFAYMPFADASFRTWSGWTHYLAAADQRVTYTGITARAVARLIIVQQCAYVLLPLAALGCVVMWRRDRARTLALALFGAFPAFVGTHFDEADPSRYFLCAAATLAVFAASAFRERQRSVRIVASVLAIAFVVGTLREAPAAYARAHDERARRETDAIVAATPPNATIIASWTLAPTLLYRARIESSLGGRNAIAGWFGEEADALPQLLRHGPVYVSGPPEGSVEGYSLLPVAAGTELYRVAPNR